MLIKKINLKNFRNYESLSLDFESTKTLLIGKNAQGKTNILDSIYYLSCLHSLNAQNDSELIQWEKDYANINADIEHGDITINLDVTLNAGKKKILKINDIKKNKSSEFISKLSVVSFSISDLLLLRGTPEDRRNWLDTAISQIYPAFDERLSKYNKVRIQKNNYLKQLKNGVQIDRSLLDVWNTQLVTTGANIIYLRMKFLAEIQKYAEQKHAQISKNEKLGINYCSGITGIFDPKEQSIPNIESIAEKFETCLNERKEEEIIRVQSVVGPHRDDISFFINSIESKKFASQGQQRTIVLALKLAELEIIENKIQTSPILLLDDVLAELDDLRQNFLLSSIKEGTQTIITSVDTLHFHKDYLKDVALYKISNNTASRCKEI